MRNCSDRIPPEQLFALADAIHEIPSALIEYGVFIDEKEIRENFLAPYDRRWATTPDSFSLIKTLDEGIRQKLLMPTDVLRID
jgi:hypothetical protein